MGLYFYFFLILFLSGKYWKFSDPAQGTILSTKFKHLCSIWEHWAVCDGGKWFVVTVK